MARCFVSAFLSMLLNAVAQTPCENLKTLTLPDATITAAESIPAGQEELPSAPGAPKLSLALPAYRSLNTGAAAASKTPQSSSAKHENRFGVPQPAAAFSRYP
jgi:hypothetical protein